VERFVKAKQLRIVLPAYEQAPVPVQLVHLPGVQTRAAAAFLDFAVARLARNKRKPAS